VNSVHHLEDLSVLGNINCLLAEVILWLYFWVHDFLQSNAMKKLDVSSYRVIN